MFNEKVTKKLNEIEAGNNEISKQVDSSKTNENNNPINSMINNLNIKLKPALNLNNIKENLKIK